MQHANNGTARICEFSNLNESKLKYERLNSNREIRDCEIIVFVADWETVYIDLYTCARIIVYNNFAVTASEHLFSCWTIAPSGDVANVCALPYVSHSLY